MAAPVNPALADWKATDSALEDADGCLPDQTLIWALGTWVHYPPILLCDVIADCL